MHNWEFSDSLKFAVGAVGIISCGILATMGWLVPLFLFAAFESPVWGALSLVAWIISVIFFIAITDYFRP